MRRDFLSLPLLYANDHSLAVDRGRLQVDGLGYPQTGRITGRQNRAPFEVPHMSEQMHNLFSADDLQQIPRLLAGWDDIFESPIFLESDLVEEAGRGDGDQYRPRRQLPLIGEIDLIGASGWRSAGDLPK